MTGSATKKRGEDTYKIRENERKTRDAPRSKPEKQNKVSLKKLERTQRFQGEGLEKVAYDPKSLKKLGGIVEQMKRRVLFYIQQKNMYICGKCILTICMNTLFHVSMQKTVRPQSGLVKKKTPTCFFDKNFHIF